MLDALVDPAGVEDELAFATDVLSVQCLARLLVRVDCAGVEDEAKGRYLRRLTKDVGHCAVTRRDYAAVSLKMVVSHRTW